MNTTEPLDPNVEAVRELLKQRAAVGLKKYGVTTERTDLTEEDWDIHLQEELLDAAVYLQAKIASRRRVRSFDASSPGPIGAATKNESEEAPETPLECADHAERFADEILADGTNPDAITLADAVKWMCAAVRQLSQSGQAAPYQPHQPQSVREDYAKWAKGREAWKYVPDAAQFQNEMRGTTDVPVSVQLGFRDEMDRFADESAKVWLQSREKVIRDCVCDFLGEVQPGDPAMLYEAMKARGVEGIILNSQATMQDKFQIRQGDQVLREIELPSVRFGKHNDDQWSKIP